MSASTDMPRTIDEVLAVVRTVSCRGRVGWPDVLQYEYGGRLHIVPPTVAENPDPATVVPPALDCEGDIKRRYEWRRRFAAGENMASSALPHRTVTHDVPMALLMSGMGMLNHPMHTGCRHHVEDNRRGA